VISERDATIVGIVLVIAIVAFLVIGALGHFLPGQTTWGPV